MNVWFSILVIHSIYAKILKWKPAHVQSTVSSVVMLSNICHFWSAPCLSPVFIDLHEYSLIRNRTRACFGFQSQSFPLLLPRKYVLCINSIVLMMIFYRQVDMNVVIFANFIFQLKYAHLKHTALNKNKDERRLFHHMFQSLLFCNHFMLSSQWS